MAAVNIEIKDTVVSQSEKEVPLTPESINIYLEHLRSVVRVQGTLES